MIPVTKSSYNTIPAIDRKWICSQIGARQHYSFPVSFEKAGVLDHFFTDMWTPTLLQGRQFENRSLRAFAHRYSRGLPPRKIDAFTLNAVAREALARVKGRFHLKNDAFEHYNSYGSWFSKTVVKRLSLLPLSADHHLFHGFTSSSLEAMRFLNRKGVPCLLQQIDAGRSHYRIVADEVQRWPGWQDGTIKVPESYFRRIEQEWEAASSVIVNSDWSRRALLDQGVPESKLVVIPLVYELSARKPNDSMGSTVTAAGLHPISDPQQAVAEMRKEPLRVLWAADVLLAKGIQYLIAAAKRLGSRKVIFLIAGTVGISREAVASAPRNMQFLGRVPRDQVAELYASSDVYVLPTLSDGFALTQLEAMAHGMPVITTPNCGVVVTDGEDGFIVPIRDEIALADAIAQLDDDRELLRRMAKAAERKVQQFSMEGYGERIIAAVAENLNRQ